MPSAAVSSLDYARDLTKVGRLLEIIAGIIAKLFSPEPPSPLSSTTEDDDFLHWHMSCIALPLDLG